MKKIVYILALMLVTSLSITSCTKEEVAPAKDPYEQGNDIKE